MKKSVLCSALFITALATLTVCAGYNRAYTQTKSEYVGSAVCSGCHKDLHTRWMPSIHGQALGDTKRPKDQSGCEACHGPGSAHLGDPEHKSIVNPAEAKSKEAYDACIGCHKKDVKGHNWQASAHAKGKVGCSSCHDVHSGKSDKALRKPQMELCFDCHKKERGQFQLASHHPLFEGRIKCSDCHNVHSGKQEFMLADSPEKDLCVRCHREKEGPFIFEHAAVSDGFGEGCLSCHRPHGSTNNDLQKLTGRGLCMQCHTDAHVNSNDPSRNVNCITCHRLVHGSDRDQLFFQ